MPNYFDAPGGDFSRSRCGGMRRRVHIPKSPRARLSRIFELAKPKPVPEGFIKDRRSVYWVDKLPPQPPTVFDISPRLAALIPSKKFHHLFVPDRLSPIWDVSRAALTGYLPESSLTLSDPKPFHIDFVPDRETPVYGVSKAALNYVATERIINLAIPKKRLSPYISSFEAKTWYDFPRVSKAALYGSATERTDFLSWPRSLPKDYREDRSVLWKPPVGLYSVQPNDRTAELAHPRPRIDSYQGYDPYYISSAARNAVASLRLGELSQPRQF